MKNRGNEQLRRPWVAIGELDLVVRALGMTDDEIGNDVTDADNEDGGEGHAALTEAGG